MGFFSTTSRVDLSFFNSIALLSLLLTPLVRATCYQPNGNIDTSVVPCNTTINSSACCAPTDSCTTSGLCLGASGYVYRSACTDLTWSSKNCPAICQNGKYLHLTSPRPVASFLQFINKSFFQIHSQTKKQTII